MLKILDRHLTLSYFKAFVVCLVSLLSMYVVVDLFMNLDEFSQNTKGMGHLLRRIGTYYGFKVVEIFDRLCEPVILLAAMFTVAWMQRNNELLPLLSAGISTMRVVRPVLLASAAMIGVGVLNQELWLPRIDSFLVEHRSEGEREVNVRGAFDTNGILISGVHAIRNELLVKDFVCTIPASVGHDGLTTMQAREARYIPLVPGEPRTGGWILTGTSTAELPSTWTRTDILERIGPGKFFLKTEVDFENVTRSRNWFAYVDTLSLVGELERGGAASNRLAGIATVIHMRLTRPILGILLVFMGLSIILQNHQRNIYISAGLCLILCLGFFASGFVCRWLGNNEFLMPALAAWLPVLFFGPLSFVMFDAVHT